MGSWGDQVAAAGAISRANTEAASASRARADLQSWKQYAAQLNEALKDSQIDVARQAVIKEECLRELFLLNPAHRLHVKANRAVVAHAHVKDALASMGLKELADDQERIDRILAT
jgi:hypothetical protein